MQLWLFTATSETAMGLFHCYYRDFCMDCETGMELLNSYTQKYACAQNLVATITKLKLNKGLEMNI